LELVRIQTTEDAPDQDETEKRNQSQKVFNLFHFNRPSCIRLRTISLASPVVMPIPSNAFVVSTTLLIGILKRFMFCS
jgi:hypothetical protein